MAGEASPGLLLLKPDGAASATVRDCLREALDRHGLDILNRRNFRLAPADVVAIWPMFGGGAHPMMSALYRHYMTCGSSEALLLRGPDAPARCSAVKSEIRRRFEVCAFENAIHAPLDGPELAANVAHIFAGTTAPPGADWPEWSKRGRFGAALGVPDGEIARIAAAIWAERMAAGWAGILPSPVPAKGAACQAVLRPGDPNSIDYGISVLFEAFPERGFEASVRLYIAAEVTGGAVLASGTCKTMEALRVAFARHRMSVEITETPVGT